jgi:hypothetical protein
MTYRPDNDINANNATSISWSAQSFVDRLKAYEKKREELLKLSKETLIDLIIQRPTF